MMIYKVLEKNYCTDHTIAGFHTPGAALDSIFDEINYMKGEVINIHYNDPKDGETYGSVIVAFKAPKPEHNKFSEAFK